MSLNEYRRKRRFDATPEPAPGARKRKGRRPIFVVQLHHASHRHYDFRLQVGNTLKSWAVPKGPSFDPKVKRMAVEVEDHPVDYAEFQGDIPKGEYGGGHVATFDKGIWSTAADPQAQLEKGHLRFELFGEKLKGGWHLVRTHKPARQPQWLLFKEPDEYAGAREADDLLQDLAPPPSGRPKRRAAAKATGGKTAAKATKKVAKAAAKQRIPPSRRVAQAAKLPGARAATREPAFFAPQLARLVDAPPAGDNWLHEAKWDGYRLIAQVRDGKARLWSRNELEWTARVPEIATAVEAMGLPDAVLDGELVAGAGTQADFGLLQATLSGEKNAPLYYVLFDLIQLGDVDLTGCAQVDRKALLGEIMQSPPARLVFSSHVTGHGNEAMEQATQRGLEGIISKRADAPYRSGRGDDWRKVKRRASEEFAVVGYTAPKGSRSGFGALLLARPDSEHGWRYAGRVGSGFSAGLLDALAPQLAKGARNKPTVHVGVDDPALRAAHWVKPQKVVEVFHHGVGNQGLLRQPSLKTFRADKRASELDDDRRAALPPPKTTPARAATRKRTTRALGNADSEVALSSPTRVVFADAGITKQDVFDYYRGMMRWLLPEVIDRPVSLVRCPQGADRPCFFQKHIAEGMEHIGAVPLEEEGGDKADYLVVRDETGLLELVQFNALELHPWGAKAEAPDKADRIVFDLDPGPDVAWTDIVAAAREVRTRLQALGLVSFVRTSGGKGLHVVVPLKPACGWDVVRNFARAFAESMSQHEPLRYVATATKKFRKGRIFIDYLRNGRGATSVASFSLRARAGAPVAMPLRWEELGRIAGGNAFDLHSAPRRVARWKGHPWGDFDSLKQNLDKVGKALDAAAHSRNVIRAHSRNVISK